MKQQEDNGKRVHVKGVLAGPRYVDHGVQGWEQQLGGIAVCRGSGGSGDSLLPDLSLQAFSGWRNLVRHPVIEV